MAMPIPAEVLTAVRPAVELLATWFAVPAFWLVIAALFADWLSGTAKALAFKEFTWRKSCAAAIKIPLYVGWYVAAQIASQIFGTEAPQHAILITLALKEFISFVQNLKAIGIRYKVNLKPLNDLVAFLRVDRFQEQLADYQKKADAIE